MVVAEWNFWLSLSNNTNRISQLSILHSVSIKSRKNAECPTTTIFSSCRSNNHFLNPSVRSFKSEQLKCSEIFFSKISGCSIIGGGVVGNGAVADGMIEEDDGAIYTERGERE